MARHQTFARSTSATKLQPTYTFTNQHQKHRQTQTPANFNPSVHIALGEAFEEYYALLKSGGKVELIREIADMPWGYKEFTVKDEDGNLLTFFRFLD